MMKRRILAASLLSFFLLASCGTDSPESLKKDLMQMELEYQYEGDQTAQLFHIRRKRIGKKEARTILSCAWKGHRSSARAGEDEDDIFFLAKCAEYSIPAERRPEWYADLLFSSCKRNGLRYDAVGDVRGNPLFVRCGTLVSEGRYDDALELVDTLYSGFDLPVHSDFDRPEAPVHADAGGLMRSFNAIFCTERNRIFLLFERARILSLKGDAAFFQVLDTAFYTAVDGLFRDMEPDSLYSSAFAFDPVIMELLPLQYNHPDPVAVFQALLVIKGTAAMVAPSMRRMAGMADSASVKSALTELFPAFDQVRSGMGEKDCLVEFYKVPPLHPDGEAVYRAAIVRKEMAAPVLVDLCTEGELKGWISSRKVYSDARGYEMIWEKILPVIGDAETVTFSADGLLNLVNLSALPDRKGDLLPSEKRWMQVTSVKVNRTAQNSIRLNGLALFGGMDYEGVGVDSTALARAVERAGFGRLPGSLEEVMAIAREAREHGIPVQILSGEEGTVSQFETMCEQRSCNILHIATHGFYDAHEAPGREEVRLHGAEGPLDRCGLLFADGWVTGSRLAGKNLHHVDLVVLSACNTALGDLSGEGVAGFQAALKRAGVQSMLLATDYVDDEATRTFMAFFYASLFEGKDIREAYNAAIRRMRNETFRDPQYWAPFILLD